MIDAKERKLIKSISLSQQYYGKFLTYSAHNVQVGPKGTIVAVTANIAEKEGNTLMEKEVNDDELVLIDPLTDGIVSRISLGRGLHLTHVVINADDTIAYTTSQEQGILYTIDLRSRSILRETKLPKGSLPHGIRLSLDGKQLFIAFIGEKAIGIVNTETSLLELVPTGDKVVQVAVTPDGKYVFGSLYGTKSVARYDLALKKLDIIKLPEGAKGPIQLYPTPDSRFLYVADQGFYFDQPTGNQIYAIDIANMQVTKSFTGGEGPHGVVVSRDGKYAYITNLLSNSVSVLDIVS